MAKVSLNARLKIAFIFFVAQYEQFEIEFFPGIQRSKCALTDCDYYVLYIKHNEAHTGMRHSHTHRHSECNCK